MNKVELFNEVCILMSGTTFILFMEENPEALKVYSYLNLSILALNLVVNWLINFAIFVRACRKNCCRVFCARNRLIIKN